MPTGTYLAVPSSDILSVEGCITLAVDADDTVIEVHEPDDPVITVQARGDDVIVVPKGAT